MDGTTQSVDNQRFWKGIGTLPEEGQKSFWDAGQQLSHYIGEPAEPRFIDITKPPPDLAWYERFFFYLGASSYNEGVASQYQAKAISEGAGWLWSALKGDFNKTPTTGQIITGGIISLIPGVDQVCDVRDVVANCLNLSDAEERKKPEAWAALGLTCIGFIPEIGSAVKTVAKAAFREAKSLLELLKIMEHLEGAFRKLGIKLPWGRAPIKWLREFDWKQAAKKAGSVAVALFTKARNLALSAARHALDAISHRLRQLAETFQVIIDNVRRAIDSVTAKIKETIEKWLPHEKKEAGNFDAELGGLNEHKQKASAPNSAPAYKSGWSQDKIKAIDKGGRPSPNDYLDKKYIDNHLSKFDKSASYLVPKDALDRYGRDSLGMPDNTQFVMTKGEMDDLLAKANGDMSVVEKELGVPPGSWQGQEMVRIDVPGPRDLNLRMPSGNEKGANELWIPGGHLPTGLDEAIIDNIPKGSYSEGPLWH